MNKHCNRVLMKLIVVLLLAMAHEAIATDTGSRGPPEPMGKCDETLCDGLGMLPSDGILIKLDPEADQWGVEVCACGPYHPVQCNPAARVGAPDACLSGSPLLETPLEIQALQERGAAITCIIIGGKRKCYKI